MGYALLKEDERERRRRATYASGWRYLPPLEYDFEGETELTDRILAGDTLTLGGVLDDLVKAAQRDERRSLGDVLGVVERPKPEWVPAPAPQRPLRVVPHKQREPEVQPEKRPSEAMQAAMRVAFADGDLVTYQEFRAAAVAAGIDWLNEMSSLKECEMYTPEAGFFFIKPDWLT